MDEFLREYNIDWGNLTLSIIAFAVLAVWFVGRFQNRLDDHGKRLKQLENQHDKLEELIDKMHTEIMHELTEIKISLVNKKDREK